MRRCLVVSFVAVVVLAVTACTPPPTPPPALPTGVGVQWLRDTGGTVDPMDGHYTPAYDRYVLLNGVVSGPTPNGSAPDVLSPVAMSLRQVLPDGTAMYPYNGFAGEGVTGTRSPSGPVTLTFSSGSCQLPLFDTEIPTVFPSPDGTKAAVQIFDSTADFSGVRIYSLVDGGNCPQVVEQHFVNPAGGGNSIFPPAVWAPDSSAIAYTIADEDEPQTQRVVRLTAVAGATPTDIIPATGSKFVPLGWSVGGRLLLQAYLFGSDEITLSTVPVTGGSLRVLDRWSSAGLSTPLPASVANYFADYLGYFVPGSTTVVFTGAQRVTNSTGQTFTWFRMRRIADADGAVSAPLANPKPTLTWHQEATDTSGGPPFTLVDVPNSEVLERFTH